MISLSLSLRVSIDVSWLSSRIYVATRCLRVPMLEALYIGARVPVESEVAEVGVGVGRGRPRSPWLGTVGTDLDTVDDSLKEVISTPGDIIICGGK